MSTDDDDETELSVKAQSRTKSKNMGKLDTNLDAYQSLPVDIDDENQSSLSNITTQFYGNNKNNWKSPNKITNNNDNNNDNISKSAKLPKKKKYFWQKQKKTKQGFKRYNSTNKISTINTTNNFDVNKIAKHRSLDSILIDEHKSNLMPSNIHYQQINLKNNNNNINNNNNSFYNNINSSLPEIPHIVPKSPENSLQNFGNNSTNNIQVLRSGGGNTIFNTSQGNLVGVPSNSVYDSVIDNNSVRDGVKPIITPSEIILFRKEKKYDKHWARARSCYTLIILGLIFVTVICTIMLLLPRGVDVTTYTVETSNNVWNIKLLNNSNINNVTINIEILYSIDNKNLVPLTINEFFTEYYIDCLTDNKCNERPPSQSGILIGNKTTDVTSQEKLVNRKSTSQVIMDGKTMFNITIDGPVYQVYNDSCYNPINKHEFTLNVNTRIKGSVALSQAKNIACNADITVECSGNPTKQTIFKCG